MVSDSYDSSSTGQYEGDRGVAWTGGTRAKTIKYDILYTKLMLLSRWQTLTGRWCALPVSPTRQSQRRSSEWRRTSMYKMQMQTSNDRWQNDISRLLVEVAVSPGQMWPGSCSAVWRTPSTTRRGWPLRSEYSTFSDLNAILYCNYSWMFNMLFYTTKISV